MATRYNSIACECIADDVKLGEDVKLYGFVNLYGCTIGDRTKIGTFVEIQKGATIGADCKISSHTFICEGVTIQDRVFVGHGVVFINDRYPRATNADGSPLTDVVSYRVYYSTTDPPCPGGRAMVAAAPKVPLPPDQRLEVRLTGLTVGKLYFVAVTAVNSRGIASTCSSTVSARARQP